MLGDLLLKSHDPLLQHIRGLFALLSGYCDVGTVKLFSCVARQEQQAVTTMLAYPCSCWTK